MQKFLSIFFTVLLVISTAPIQVLANETDPNLKSYLIQITWGDTKDKIQGSSFIESEDFSGYIQSDERIYVQKTLNFEGTDSINNNKDKKISFDSQITAGTDGLIIDVLGKNNSSFTIYNQYFEETVIDFRDLTEKERTIRNKNNGYSLNVQLLNKNTTNQRTTIYNPYVLEITWGDLLNLNKGDTKVTESTSLDGSVTAEGAKIEIMNSYQFEKNDSLTSNISWNSEVTNNTDGVIALVTPDATQEPSITVNINTNPFQINFDSTERRFLLEDNYYLQVTKLGTYKNAPSKSQLQGKAEIKTSLGQFQARFDDLNDECKETLKQIDQYSLVNINSSSLTSHFQNSNNISVDDARNIEIFCQGLKSRFNELKSKSQNEKFAAKLIPFVDTDDNQWYTQYVAELKNTTVNNQKIIEGYKDSNGNPTGYYGPEETLKLGEVIKIAMVLGRHNSLFIGIPPEAQNHWAGGYLAKARTLKLKSTQDITSSTQLNSTATRGQAFYILAEALNLIDENTSVQLECQGLTYKDLSLSQKETVAACALSNEGIISGDANGRLNLNDPINRAEIAKVVVNMYKVFAKNLEEANIAN